MRLSITKLVKGGNSVFGLLIICPGSFLADINLGLIRFVLHQENVQETMDNFKFLVKDSKPNVVSDNVFHIQWSLISFEHKRSVICMIVY